MNFDTSNIEKALIGTLIADDTLWSEVRVMIDCKDFYNLKCAEIYGVIEKLDCKVDLNILLEHLSPELMAIARETMILSMPSQILEYAKIVRGYSRKRQAIEEAEHIKINSMTMDPVNDIVKTAVSRLERLMENDGKVFRHAGEIAVDYVNRIMMLKEKGVEVSGLTTGYRSLDLTTDGFKPGELIIIGSRPSIGKTSMMLCFSEHIGCVLKKNVAIFSIESPEGELFNRMVSIRAEITTQRLRTGQLNAYEHERMMLAAEDLGASGISINDLSVIDILTVKNQARKLIAEGKRPDIIFVDYLQIMETERSNDTFANKISRVTQGFKNLAKELMIPVVVLAQINRANGEEPPRLMDLKDSGGIEAIADMVILLHREEFYKKDGCSLEKKGIIEVDVAKNRNGRTALINLGWRGEFTKIV